MYANHEQYVQPELMHDLSTTEQALNACCVSAYSVLLLHNVQHLQKC